VGSGVTAIVPSISPYVRKQFTNTAIELLFEIAQLEIVCLVWVGRITVATSPSLTMSAMSSTF
jgi:hypothetical protein